MEFRNKIVEQFATHGFPLVHHFCNAASRVTHVYTQLKTDDTPHNEGRLRARSGAYVEPHQADYTIPFALLPREDQIFQVGRYKEVIRNVKAKKTSLAYILVRHANLRLPFIRSLQELSVTSPIFIHLSTEDPSRYDNAPVLFIISGRLSHSGIRSGVQYRHTSVDQVSEDLIADLITANYQHTETTSIANVKILSIYKNPQYCVPVYSWWNSYDFKRRGIPSEVTTIALSGRNAGIYSMPFTSAHQFDPSLLVMPTLTPSESRVLEELPLPRPPPSEEADLIMATVIEENKHFFPVKTELNIEKFAELLIDFPNQPFATSMLQGFRESFWPWAHPYVLKNPAGFLQQNHSMVTGHSKFLFRQCQKQLDKGFWSGPLISPLAYTRNQPIGVIPKKDKG